MKNYEKKTSANLTLSQSTNIHGNQRILLGQLGSNGDCLYATVLARQIKQDYPNCHLTWAVSSACRGMVEGNPFVDNIWEVPLASLANWNDMVKVWHQWEQEAKSAFERGDFDKIFLTQISPGNLQNFDGTIRPSIFRAYPHPISVPIQNILRLTEVEVERVQQFVEQHELTKRSHLILFECSSKSGQSFVTPQYANEVSQHLLSKLPDCAVILSSHIKIDNSPSRIIDGSVLSLRQTAELTKYCHLLIGCSSGVTQIALTDWAKPLPMIQLLKSSTSVYASIVHDFEHWGLPTEWILEMTDCHPYLVSDCAYLALTQSFSQTRLQFHQSIPIFFDFYLTQLDCQALQLRHYNKVARAILYAAERYGWHPQLKTFVQNKLIPQTGLYRKLAGEHDYINWLQDLITKDQIDSLNDTNYSSGQNYPVSNLIYSHTMTQSTDYFWQQRQLRYQIAQQWLKLTADQLEGAYASEFGKTYQSLLNSGIKDQPMTTEELAFANTLRGQIAKGFANPQAIQYLLAATLYWRADQLPIPYWEATLPAWWINDYLKF
ncbi:MAG: hypothetical protein BWK78_00715, partial [Thiotrichaceae bacterium IS1]